MEVTIKSRNASYIGNDSTSATDAQVSPVERILALLPTPAKPYSHGYLALCPAHGDRSPSLMIWEDETDGHVGLKCFTGCTRKQIVEALGITEYDLYLHTGERKAGQQRKIIDICDLGIDKGIHPHDLDRLGLRNGACTYTKRKGAPTAPYDVKGVVIPYYTIDGTEYPRHRLRVALSGSPKHFWNEDNEKTPHPIIAYGMHRLGDARKAGYIVLVEGESDCWTLWLHKFPALGIPGVEMVNTTLQKSYFEGIERVYIVQEPPSEDDIANGRDPGKKFVSSVEKKLKQFGYPGRAYAINFKAETGEKDPNELHKKDVKAFKQAFDTVLLRARPLFAGHKQQTAIGRSLKELMGRELPPVRWAVPDILPEGLTLLCGKPKLGKSWLALHVALAVAFGGVALSAKEVEQGQVLYLALEDNERRMQDRVRMLTQLERSIPDDFDYDLQCPRLDQGGYELLEEWIQGHSRARLIVIDTWVKISPRPEGRKRSQYEEDYDSLSILKALSDQYHVAILAIHHLRKTPSEANDFLDEISGSVGVSGTVDGILGLKRERGQFDAALHVTGREIKDDTAYALSFDQSTALWKLQGKAEEFAKTKERQAILDLLKEAPDGLSARGISDQLEKNFYTTRNLLNKMVKAKEIEHQGAVYHCKENQKNDNERSQRSQRSQCGRRSHRSQSDTSASFASQTDHDDTTNDHGSDHGAKNMEGPVEAFQDTCDYDDHDDHDDMRQLANIVSFEFETDEKKPDFASKVTTYRAPGVVTSVVTQQKCSTSFNRRMSEGHQGGTRLTADMTGHLWCEHCEKQRELMNIGCTTGYPLIAIAYKGTRAKIPAGKDQWLKFARTAGHVLVAQAVEDAQKLGGAA